MTKDGKEEVDMGDERVTEELRLGRGGSWSVIFALAKGGGGTIAKCL